MEGEPSRWPATVGALAMVAGAALIAASAGNHPPRPRVLGEMLVPTTTSTARATAGTDASSPPTSRVATARRANTTTTRGPEPSTSTTRTAVEPSTSTSASVAGSTSTTAPTEPCPAGAPVADIRTWDVGGESGGPWHVTVTGVVVNRTGAAVDVGPVAVTISRADGDTYVVPADARPTPDPSTVADDGEATWRWEGDVPAGSAPAGAHAGVTDWSWVGAPPGCGD